MVIDVVRPRVHWVPACEESLGAEAAAWCRRVGLTLDPEQELVLEGMLGVRRDGRWQTREVGINMPRQNGKGEVLLARELYGLFELGERLVIHTAHEFKTSAEHFQRLEAVFRANPELDGAVFRRPSGQVTGYRYSHGEESITLQDGRRIEFKTRTKSGMRGFAGVDFLALDEAMIILEAGLNSALPIIRASKAERGPQICYAGSAVDQETHDHGVVWTRVRERGMAGGDESLAYFEWSLDFDHPDDVPDEVVDDPDQWRLVNIALAHGRVLEEHMEWERRALSRRGFIVELLGVPDSPATDAAGSSVIDLKVWAGLADAGSRLLDPVCLTFDVSPDRSVASIAAAGKNAKGLAHVEIVDRRGGTGWVAARLAELCASHDVASVSCDGAGPASSLVPEIEALGVVVEVVSGPEHASACGFMFDLVAQSGLRHLGSMELTAAIKGAVTRPLGEKWAWARRKSNADITPLVAATLALWASATPGETEFVWGVAA